MITLLFLFSLVYLSYIYIYIYHFVGPNEKKVNSLKWIELQGGLFWSYLFLFNKRFKHFKLSSGSINGLFFGFPLIYIVMNILKRSWFFLTPWFVSVNSQFELIVQDNFSSLQVLFSLLFPLLFSQECILWVSVSASAFVFMYASLSLSLSLSIYIYIYIYIFGVLVCFSFITLLPPK